MSLLAFLRLVDFFTSIAVDSAVLVWAFTAYRRTQMRAFALLLWGSFIGIILSAGLEMQHRTSHTSSDALTFTQLYRIGYMLATILWGTGIILLIRHVLIGVHGRDKDDT